MNFSEGNRVRYKGKEYTIDKIFTKGCWLKNDNGKVITGIQLAKIEQIPLSELIISAENSAPDSTSVPELNPTAENSAPDLTTEYSVPEPEPELESEPELQTAEYSASEPELELEPEFKLQTAEYSAPESESKLESELEPQLGSESEPEPELSIVEYFAPGLELKPEFESQFELKLESESESEIESEPGSELQTAEYSAPELEPELEPEPEFEPQSAFKLESESESIASVQWVNISEICEHSDFQPREHMDGDAIARYVEMLEYSNPPAIELWLLPDPDYKENRLFLIHGHHRFYAARKAKKEIIEAEIKEGDWQSAIMAASTANLVNGLQLNKQDLENACKNYLRAIEVSKAKISNREVGRIFGLNEKTVRNYKKDLEIEEKLSDWIERQTRLFFKKVDDIDDKYRYGTYFHRGQNNQYRWKIYVNFDYQRHFSSGYYEIDDFEISNHPVPELHNFQLWDVIWHFDYGEGQIACINFQEMPDFVEYPQVSYYLCLFESGFKECYKHGLEFDRPGEMPLIENQIQIIKDAIASIEDGPDAERKHENLNEQLAWLKTLLPSKQQPDDEQPDGQQPNGQQSNKQFKKQQFDSQPDGQQSDGQQPKGQSDDQQSENQQFDGKEIERWKKLAERFPTIDSYGKLAEEVCNELPEFSDSDIEYLWSEIYRERMVRGLSD